MLKTQLRAVHSSFPADGRTIVNMGHLPVSVLSVLLRYFTNSRNRYHVGTITVVLSRGN